MSSLTASRTAPLVTSEAPSLADVRRQIAIDPALDARRRQDIASAINTVARAIGRRPEEIPAHPGHLRKALEAFSPVAHDMSWARWRNVLSLLRAALQHAGLARMPGRHMSALAPEWAGLFSAVTNRKIRYGLSRFAHYCSIKRIGPDSVDNELVGQFVQEIESAGIGGRPYQIHRNVCTVWNRAAAAVPNWPQNQLQVPSRRLTYVRPWSEFPASLKADRDGWLERLAGKDLFEDLGFKPLRPASIKTRTRQVRIYLAALVEVGYAPDQLKSLADIVSCEALKVGLRVVHGRSPTASKRQAHQIACAVTAIARHWVKVDLRELEQLRGLCRHINPGGRTMADKSRGHLRQFDDRQNVLALVALPQRVAAKMGREPTRAEALEFQSALLLEILLMFPMRLKNLAALDLERHIKRSASGNVVHIVLTGEEVKNGADLQAELPGPSVALLDRYLALHRPLLISRPTSALFPGQSRPHKAESTVYHQIVRFVRRHTGLVVYPHLFRHFGTTQWLMKNPGNYGVPRLLLGHKSVDTTAQFYAGTEAAAAVRHFDEFILGLRELADETPPKKRRRRS